MSQLNWASHTTLGQPPLEGIVDISQLSGERAAHASGHKYREALTHTNKSMHAYADTQMDTI